MKCNEYKVWATNRFSADDMLVELVAIFFDLDKAIEFVNSQMDFGFTYIIKHNGKKIDID